MKNFKRFFTSSLIVLMLVASAYATMLPRGGAPGFPAIQVFTPPASSPIVTIAGAGDVTVSAYSVIMFQDDITIYYGTDTTNTYLLPANTPLGIAPGVTTIHVDTGTSIMVM